ncbi:MAG: hypothetical protein LLG14_24870, partial [Nocardiaceae bacterium]|nr:hypothetical protein [Nocardiaceae bacterium]
MLTDKERQVRALDLLGAALKPIVDGRMTAAAPAGQPWLPLYEAKEAARRGHRYTADLEDPRLLLQILFFENRVFTDLNSLQRTYTKEILTAANTAAHTMSRGKREVDRAIDTMILLAESLELDDAANRMRELIEREPEVATVPSSKAAKPVRLDLDLPRGIRALAVRVDGVEVTVLYREAVNLALAHNSVSPVTGVTVVNPGSQRVLVESLELTIESPTMVSSERVAAPLTIEIGTVEPRATIEIPSAQLRWRIDPNVFAALDEAVTTELTLTVKTASGAYTAKDDIRLLTADEWWARGIPESLAAFVRPNASSIAGLLKSASDLLGRRTGNPSLDGYQRGPDRAHRIVEAIYDAMAALNITYVE